MFAKMIRLTSADRSALCAALLVVPIVRAALWLLPFSVTRRACGRVMRRHADAVTNGSPERIVWAVKAVAARVPGGSCLTQSLSAAMLLSHAGHRANLRVGVARAEDGSFRAHAWLESEGGTAILGEPPPGTFTPFPTMDLL